MARTHKLVALGGAFFLTLATLAGMAAAQAPGGAAGRGPGGGQGGSGGPGFEEHFGGAGGRHGGFGGQGFGWHNPERMLDRIFERFDRNYDGVIEASEFKAVIEHRFDQFDKAKKGVLSAADMKARFSERLGNAGGPRHQRTEDGADRFIGRFMQSFGKAPDGQVTKAEFVDAYMDVFKYINRAGNGKITRGEIEQYMNVARRIAPALRG